MGIFTTLIVVLVGSAVGALAGFFGGIFDALLSRVTDIFFAVPFVLAAIVVMQMFRNDLQHEVRIDGELYRLDFLWPHTMVGGEFDGHVKYTRNSFGKDAENTVWDERQRELALIRAGYDLARWTWKDAWPNDAPTMCRELARHGIHPTGVRW